MEADIENILIVQTNPTTVVIHSMTDTAEVRVTHTYIHTYIDTYILTYIHTYIHTYTHTCTYIHTHTLAHTHTFFVTKNPRRGWHLPQ